MQIDSQAANQNSKAPARCLTDHDRALLRVVTGWPMPGEAPVAMAADADGRPLLIPVLAWVLADARRSGALAGAITPGGFTAAARAVNASHSASLRLSRSQIADGFRHLAIGMMGFSAGRAGAAAG
jgi:hypothetical protein